MAGFSGEMTAGSEIEATGALRALVRAEHDESPWRLRFGSIYRALRQRITLLSYPPGMRLDIDALAAEFGVSRTPIRTVLQQLERDGLAVSRHGVGTAVTEVDLKHAREATILRMHLAELIGELQPQKPSEEALRLLEELRQACTTMPAEPDLAAFARIDMALHDCKCGLIGNEPLKRIYDELYYRTVRMWFSLLPRLHWPTEVAALAGDLRSTLRALAIGDVAAVGYITRNAIFEALFRLGDIIGEEERKAP